MLSKISWHQYWNFILITCCIYYFVICCSFYAAKIKNFLSGKSMVLETFGKVKASIRSSQNSNTGNANVEDLVNPVSNMSESEIHSTTQQCKADIKSFIENAVEEDMMKQELLYGLQRITSNYQAIRNTPLQFSVNTYIMSECLTYCSIHLNEDDFKEVWVM